MLDDAQQVLHPTERRRLVGYLWARCIQERASGEGPWSTWWDAAVRDGLAPLSAARTRAGLRALLLDPPPLVSPPMLIARGPYGTHRPWTAGDRAPCVLLFRTTGSTVHLPCSHFDRTVVGARFHRIRDAESPWRFQSPDATEWECGMEEGGVLLGWRRTGDGGAWLLPRGLRPIPLPLCCADGPCCPCLVI